MNIARIYPQPGWVEHDAEEIWQNVLDVLNEVGRRVASRSDIVGLAITNQRETFVVFDRQTGKPLTTRSSGSAAAAMRFAGSSKRPAR